MNEILKTLATVINNPLLGGGSSLRLPQLAYCLKQLGDGKDEKELTSMLEEMAETGRMPTATENALLTESVEESAEELDSEDESEDDEDTPALEEILAESIDGIKDVLSSLSDKEIKKLLKLEQKGDNRVGAIEAIEKELAGRGDD